MTIIPATQISFKHPDASCQMCEQQGTCSGTEENLYQTQNQSPFWDVFFVIYVVKTILPYRISIAFIN